MQVMTALILPACDFIKYQMLNSYIIIPLTKPINFLDTAKFHGPKWTTLPGAYIRSKLGEINDEFND